ncbi:MAG TPA: SGNH/GDSL hydrolase family protein [Solirubrobacterales bacterium]|nr:SGNH/GDSL hydrolase family protein [Solirubrobacterales bacterium]
MRSTRLSLSIFPPLVLGLLVLAACASARPVKDPKPQPKVAVGNPVVGTSANGLDSILVPVHYPIQLKGRLAELRVALIGARGKTIRSWVLHERLNGGQKRLPDRRRRFTFVHRVGLDTELSRQLRQGASVRVLASGRLDIEGDGKAELSSRDLATGRPLRGPRPKPVCSSIPHLRVKPGARISVPLPVCDTQRPWAARKGSRGHARVRAGRLIYEAPQGFRGSDEVELVSRSVRQYAQVTIGTASSPRVRALGDSVTAGFGYYWNGEPMSGAAFAFYCRPAPKNMNDACSSNSMATTAQEETSVDYSPDYGLATGASWAAQWATDNGVLDYKNFAISGAEPRNWAPSGSFYKTTKTIEEENPDYVLLTLGANPMLSNMMLEPANWWCAVEKGLSGFEKCIEEEFTKVELRRWLKSLYVDLLKKTSATIYVMQYHLSIPVLAVFDRTVEIARANQMLNEEIAAAVAEFKGNRLKLVTPPHFNVGIDISPVAPTGSKCPPADGPSVQAWLTQDELKLLHPETFCKGPEAEGESEWVIAADSGIHPSITGYVHMASAVPPIVGD